MTNLHTLRGSEQQTAWILLTPALLLLLFVFAYPILRAFWLSVLLEIWEQELQPVFSGLDNYVRMVGDGRFWQEFV
ncbi:sugar ABC transporter permease, partial [Nostoc sp. HG1]|nr:sugar ABC transporter permease [Nostoc sp. HG1]